MKYTFLLFSLLVFGSCQSKSQPKETTLLKSYFFVGTYTQNDSEGIYKYSLSSEGKLDSIHLAAKLENPSYLTFSKHKKYLISVVENETGAVNAYTVTGDSLVFNNSIPSGGSYPCFVRANDKKILVANYGGGNVSLLDLNPKGILTSLDLHQHTGKGTHKNQDKPHAHSAYFLANSKEIVSADLGTNELWFSQIINNKIVTSAASQLQMAPASGPRHLAIHDKGWIYVINELNNTVSLIIKNKNGNYTRQSSASTLPDSFKGESYCADIHLSPNGLFLYASNRGHNSITLFGVSPKDGSLKYIGNYSVRGDWPRNFSISPDGKFLLVANQKSNNIVSFSIDPHTGVLTFVDEIYAPMPVCLLFE